MTTPLLDHPSCPSSLALPSSSIPSSSYPPRWEHMRTSRQRRFTSSFCQHWSAPPLPDASKPPFEWLALSLSDTITQLLGVVARRQSVIAAAMHPAASQHKSQRTEKTASFWTRTKMKGSPNVW